MGAGEVEVEVGEVLMFVNFMGDERRRGGVCVCRSEVPRVPRRFFVARAVFCAQ